jgi:hypothetical protein
MLSLATADSPVSVSDRYTGEKHDNHEKPERGNSGCSYQLINLESYYTK